MQKKIALITGLNGQDGYYLSRFLLKKGYKVYGVVRKRAIHTIPKFPKTAEQNIIPIYADITDFNSILDVIKTTRPTEIYNLAGQSDIPTSWRLPTYTAQVNAIGTLNILESIRLTNKDIYFYQASTSELYGYNNGANLSETVDFAPRNPYGTAKLFAHCMTINYRESYGLNACAGIMFNHESERRGIEFVTRKISSSVAKIKLEIEDHLEIGNLDAVRDWGSAEDYIRAMWLMLQQEKPKEYVIATGVGHTVRQLVETAFRSVDIDIIWDGKHLEEKGYNVKTQKLLVKINPQFYRYPSNDVIIGNPLKIQQELQFRNECTFEQLINSMVKYDIEYLKRIQYSYE